MTDEFPMRNFIITIVITFFIINYNRICNNKNVITQDTTIENLKETYSTVVDIETFTLTEDLAEVNQPE